MSEQQYPQPQQPGWGGQQQPGYGPPPFQPQPPKKSNAGKIIGLGCLGVVALFVLIGIVAAVAGGGSDNSADTSNKDKAVAASSAPKKSDGAKPAPAEETKTQAEQFKACVAKSGTPTEKKAVQHVTKVTGTDKRNDILDAAEVYTDYSGGIIGPHQGDGKLIASAFTSCYESKNGLVTVYDKDGELLSNANY
ncbi:hypothetical protein SY2F82_46580 [Streptomyces sp. Y2F8-2]|uniref:hypothetical protein n=1 Tax=Streptomyces sp. Y2F8-2 TaxID=2759675 RepID=UPI00190357E0|nr:hypothetical protein [Streptomyces sp. Y2F8-2]GHK02861.1 hypothetical protein SY2F82_46580 [Streptomyces sp. Y2F8-2]